MNEIIINGDAYVKKSDFDNLENFESSILAAFMVGEYVIVRSRNEGLNFGRVRAADETGIVLENCRRLWGHHPNDEKLSWYEGVVISGMGKNSKISVAVPIKFICEDYSAVPVSEIAKKSIMEFQTHAQN